MRKIYRTERTDDGYGKADYGYEGDGNPKHEKMLLLLTIAEQKATLANPGNVDLSVQEYDEKMTSPFF